MESRFNSNGPKRCPICSAPTKLENTKISVADGNIYFCNACRGYFLFPPKFVEYNGSGWSELRNRTWEWDVNLANHCAPAIKREIENYLNRKIMTVLEIGCGSAFMGRGFLNIGCKYTGIEVDTESINFAKVQGIDVYEIPVEKIGQIPLPYEKYDLIISSNVFEHLDDPMNALLNLKSVCGGGIVIIVPNANGLFHKVSFYKSIFRLFSKVMLKDNRENVYAIDGYWHNISFSLHTLVYLCNNAGLKIIKISPIGTNDHIFGFVQPHNSLWYRFISRIINLLLPMEGHIVLIAKP